ncbi:hypothetical protein MLD38_017450 [Melastoma candidum]|uniref:Uncharacterized protein n=1 Tax=Melastoma candidum TaxID=119954 RepID=A0ACB9QSK6_9MYRT|nr:hypothetical protein MLD38_017450 [Melastoma candidum]
MESLFKDHVFAAHALAGASSVALAASLTYPFDTIKTVMQVGSTGSSKPLSPVQVVERIKSMSGSFGGLYSGLSWLTLGRTVGLGARFGVYEILTAFYRDGRKDNYVYVSEALVAGVVAGAAESIATSPFELLKVRSQVTSASRVPSTRTSFGRTGTSSITEKLLRGYGPDRKILNQYVGLLSTLSTKHSNMAGALRDYPWMMSGSGRPPSVCDVKRPLDVISLEGPTAMWKGLRSGVARDSFFAGIFFSSWQFMHEALLDWKAVGMNPIPSSNEEVGPLSPIAVSLSAGLSGVIAAAGSHCFDTASSRSLCTVLPKYVSMERRLLKWNTPGNRFERITGIHPSDRNILFRGIWVRMARSGISSSLIVGAYFFSIDLLTSS